MTQSKSRKDKEKGVCAPLILRTSVEIVPLFAAVAFAALIQTAFGDKSDKLGDRVSKTVFATKAFSPIDIQSGEHPFKYRK